MTYKYFWELPPIPHKYTEELIDPSTQLKYLNVVVKREVMVADPIQKTKVYFPEDKPGRTKRHDSFRRTYVARAKRRSIILKLTIWTGEQNTKQQIAIGQRRLSW